MFFTCLTVAMVTSFSDKMQYCTYFWFYGWRHVLRMAPVVKWTLCFFSKFPRWQHHSVAVPRAGAGQMMTLCLMEFVMWRHGGQNLMFMIDLLTLQGNVIIVWWRGSCTGLGFKWVEQFAIRSSTHNDHNAGPCWSVLSVWTRASLMHVYVHLNLMNKTCSNVYSDTDVVTALK